MVEFLRLSLALCWLPSAASCMQTFTTCRAKPSCCVTRLPGGLEVTEAVAEQCCKAAKANASLYSVHQLLKVHPAVA